MNPKIGSDGSKIWENSQGRLHRDNGPAWEFASGSKCWYKNGKAHREDGPACEWANGDKWWYINGKHIR